MNRASLLLTSCLLAPACSPGPADGGGVDGCRDEPGVICTWAGTGDAGFNSSAALTESRLYWPADVSFTSSGAYVLDWNNHRVRRVTEDGRFETVIGTDFIGDGPSDLSDLEPPGAPGTEIDLNHPTEVHELPDGTVLLMAWHNHKLRRYDPTTGLAYVMCGSGPGYAGDGGSCEEALFSQPTSAAIAADGSIYVLDQRNQRIRRIDPAGMVESVVGTGEAGFNGDEHPPTEAQLNFPAGSNPPPSGGLALDDDGRLYISDSLNHRIRRVDFSANTIETVAGTGEAGLSGDGGAAVEAMLSSPRDLELGPDGRLFFSDEGNHRVRAVNLEDGTIETVAGNGDAAFTGDGAAATEASLDQPSGLAFDPAGNLYIADSNNHRIRRVAAVQE